MKPERDKMQPKQMQALSITLTEDQVASIQRFWREVGGTGTVAIRVELVNDKVSAASIQVGTTK